MLKHWLIVCMLILALTGCGSLSAASQVQRTLPPVPNLESLIVTDDGGICMNKTDAAELYMFIDQIERQAAEQ